MHAYLVTGLTERSQVRPANTGGCACEDYQTWIACDSRVLLAESAEAARKKLEAWLSVPIEGDNPQECEIKRIVAAQIIPELFTEAGPAPLDLPAISNQVIAILQSLPPDDFEQGYWVDVEQAVPPEPLSASVEDLQREVPEDISSGLNWSPERQFIYVLSLMTPPPKFPGQEGADDPEADGESREEAWEAAAEYYRQLQDNPQAADKQAAAIIQARNSVVATWLWRRYAAAHQLAALPIRLDPWCGLLELPQFP